MAWISYSNTNGELIQVSDYEIGMGNDMSIMTHTLPKVALETEYTWDKELKDFVVNNSSKTNLSRLEFLRRFTAQERITIRQKAQTDAVIFDAVEMINLADYVSLLDSDTINLVYYLSNIGVITPERTLEILK